MSVATGAWTLVLLTPSAFACHLIRSFADWSRWEGEGGANVGAVDGVQCHVMSSDVEDKDYWRSRLGEGFVWLESCGSSHGHRAHPVGAVHRVPMVDVHLEDNNGSANDVRHRKSFDGAHRVVPSGEG